MASNSGYAGPYIPQPDMQEFYPVPENTVGLVIGKGGSEIQAIQAKTGAKVQMSQSSDNTGFRQVTLQGQRPEIEHAKELLAAIINRAQQRQRHQENVIDKLPIGDSAITVDILIDSTHCGLVIGKQGETIRKLQEQSGCKMKMVQDGHHGNGTSKPLRITGEPQNVEHAKQLVFDLTNGSNTLKSTNPIDMIGTSRGEVLVPRNSVGAIIGKNGETVRRLGVETGTKVQFKPDEDQGSSDRCAVIIGTKDQIFKATDMITELVKKSETGPPPKRIEEKVTMIYMMVPAAKCGIVIGKNGETIKNINAESGAFCELNRETNTNTKVKEFMIRGTQYQIEYAQHLISIKTGEIAANTPFVPTHPQVQPAPYQHNQDNEMFYMQQAHSSQFYYNGFPEQPIAQPVGQYFNNQPHYQHHGPPRTSPHGMADYSTQWAEYYRSVGMNDQASLVEMQVRQKANGSGAHANMYAGVNFQQQPFQNYAPMNGAPMQGYAPQGPPQGPPFPPQNNFRNNNFPNVGRY